MESPLTRPLGVVLAALLALTPQPPADPLDVSIALTLRQRERALVAIRHDIHQHPELSGEEARTAGIVADHLRELGFEVRTGVGGHGVVGLLRGSRAGPVVAFRADLDAAPSGDTDPAPYRSLTPGVRHICGHDIHTTIGLALAAAFAPLKSELPGSVLLIFQPAEERATGARAMLADSVFALARPVAIYALHTAPLQVGMIGSEPGPLLAGRDEVTVTLTGPAARAAADSVISLLRRTGTITPQEARGSVPRDFVMTEIQPPMLLGDSVVVRATLSIADPDARERAQAAMIAGVNRLQSGGLRTRMAYNAQQIAGVTNDFWLTERGEDRIRAVLGDGALTRVGVVSPLFSEDFGSFQERVPGVMFLLGVSNASRGWVGMPHSPAYMADDGAIVIGARAMAAVILGRMRAGD
jgi:metal-dependent amidase/aminoacylase/carboxypeptidase family protein